MSSAITRRILPKLKLFVGNHCSLCVTAKSALDNVKKQIPFEVETVNIYDKGQERWKSRYVYEIPVLMLGDQVKARGRWGESEILKALEDLKQEKTDSQGPNTVSAKASS